MWLAAARSGRTFLCLSSNNKLNAVACCTASLLAGVALVFPLHLAVPMCIHGSTLQQLCALPPTPHGPWWEGGKGLVLKPPGGGERTLFFVCLACVELKFVAISCPLPPLRELIFVLPHGGSRLTDTPPLLADARAGLAGCRIGVGLTSLPPPQPTPPPHTHTKKWDFGLFLPGPSWGREMGKFLQRRVEKLALPEGRGQWGTHPSHLGCLSLHCI